MKEIPLTRGMVALVDDEYYDVLRAISWCAQRTSGTKFYAATAWLDGKTKLMHRLITCAPPRMQVDHIDKNSLNNQVANLRICTPSQNAYNRGPSLDRRFKGAYLDARRGHWYAKIRADGRTVQLGRCETEEAAARAYDAAALRYHGEFASLNFPQR